MQKESPKTHYHIIAAIIFSVAALGSLQAIFGSDISANPFVIIMLLLNLATLAAQVLIAVFLFRGKRDKRILIGFTLLAVCAFIQLLLGFKFGYYNASSYTWDDDYVSRFNLLCLLPWLAYFASSWSIAFVAHTEYTDSFARYQPLVRKYWFLPGALRAAALALALLVQVLLLVDGGGDWLYYDAFISFSKLFHHLLLGGGLLFASLWMVYPDGLPESEHFGAPSFADHSDGLSGAEHTGAPAGRGYCGIIKFLLLTFFTLGIYYWIWIYRTTKYLNRVEGEPKQRPRTQVLATLFMFFLGYHIYWTYKNAQRIDTLARQTGIRSNIAVVCLVFSVFLPTFIVSAIVMQDRINTIAQIEAGLIPPPAEPAAVVASPVRVNDNPDGLPEL